MDSIHPQQHTERTEAQMTSPANAKKFPILSSVVFESLNEYHKAAAIVLERNGKLRIVPDGDTVTGQ